MLTGEALRRAREDAGLLRRELGVKIGVNELAIKNVELGRVRDGRVEAKMRAYLERLTCSAVRS